MKASTWISLQKISQKNRNPRIITKKPRKPRENDLFSSAIPQRTPSPGASQQPPGLQNPIVHHATGDLKTSTHRRWRSLIDLFCLKKESTWDDGEGFCSVTRVCLLVSWLFLDFWSFQNQEAKESEGEEKVRRMQDLWRLGEFQAFEPQSALELLPLKNTQKNKTAKRPVVPPFGDLRSGGDDKVHDIPTTVLGAQKEVPATMPPAA